MFLSLEITKIRWKRKTKFSKEWSVCVSQFHVWIYHNHLSYSLIFGSIFHFEIQTEVYISKESFVSQYKWLIKCRFLAFSFIKTTKEKTNNFYFLWHLRVFCWICCVTKELRIICHISISVLFHMYYGSQNFYCLHLKSFQIKMSQYHL